MIFRQVSAEGQEVRAESHVLDKQQRQAQLMKCFVCCRS